MDLSTCQGRLYYSDPYLFQCEATVVKKGEEDGLPYITVDETIFHPQGGGQPDDKGFIKVGGRSLEVIKLDEREGVIKHFYREEESSLEEGESVELSIDSSWRKLLMRIHSAGHLIEDAAARLYPQIEPYKGCHFPDRASVNFSISKEDLNSFDFVEAKALLQAQVNQFILQNLPLTMNYNEEGKRWVQFADHNSCFCGGTHVSESSEVGEMQIRYVKRDKTRNGVDVKIGYEVAPENKREEEV